jgi:hypothetical protein
MDEGLKQLSESDAGIITPLVDLKADISQSFEKLGDRLVAEFRKLAAQDDLRMRQVDKSRQIIGERMLAVEDRVSALERQRSA